MASSFRLFKLVEYEWAVRSLYRTYSTARGIKSFRQVSLKAFSRSYSRSGILLQDGRSRLSRIWAPSGGISEGQGEDGHSRLIRAGFIRQGHSGIFHMLPLGRRVQGKIERLIDKHMSILGASRLDLSSISSEALWRKSGRLNNVNSELFRFKDRKDTSYLLSPTHEEEITNLVANAVKSYKELPALLYQISRKYRDELRPRNGLLRSREFVMKDLYTFDYSTSLALATYAKVRKAYTTFFDELKIGYLVAEADSGDMGGSLSHEFHFPTPKGDDHVISCTSCDYVANEELARCSFSEFKFEGDSVWTFASPDQISTNSTLDTNFSVWRGLSRDRKKLINVWYALASSSTTGLPPNSKPTEINTYAVRAVIPELDAGVEDAPALWTRIIQSMSCNGEDGAARFTMPRIINLVDYRLPTSVIHAISSRDQGIPLQPKAVDQSTIKIPSSVLVTDPLSDKPLNLTRIKNGDPCPRCEGKLRVERAIELGHTFFLGSRYSDPLNALVSLPMSKNRLQDNEQEARNKPTGQGASESIKVPIQMGCHGIGVSRMIGAVAEILSDNIGLNWPSVIAPYELVIIPTYGNENGAVLVYDALSIAPQGSKQGSQRDLDIILDDREQPFAWKIRDADLVGYPVIVVVGKRWKINGTCEVQSRRLSICEDVPLGQLSVFVNSLLTQL